MNNSRNKTDAIPSRRQSLGKATVFLSRSWWPAITTATPDTLTVSSRDYRGGLAVQSNSMNWPVTTRSVEFQCVPSSINWAVHVTNWTRFVPSFTRAPKATTGPRCWWRSRLRHCATSRKIAGSIPDGVIGFFHWHNPSGRTMALRLTQALTEMSTRNISWG